jgi:hypothetical protein
MIYTDVDKSVWPAAEWSVRAMLDFLEGKDQPPTPSGSPPSAP